MKFEKVSYEQFVKDLGDRFNFEEQMRFAEMKTVKEVYDAIELPRRATAGSAGYDFFLPFDLHLTVNDQVLFPTGIKVKLDKDKVLVCSPRSGLGSKYGFRLMNTIGWIDSDYYNNPKNEGHIFAKVTVDSESGIDLRRGDAFMQGIIMPYFVVDGDDATAERVGGMGSTGA
jgi:dUTP pyrophosphatase